MYWLCREIQPCPYFCSTTALLEGLRFFPPSVEMRSFRHTLTDDQYSCLSCSSTTVAVCFGLTVLYSQPRTYDKNYWPLEHCCVKNVI
ncbi:hypothetical protein AMELA_G00231770 [Ameiurus melas]|uniref:Uncharacterized protein n=1 Tax=Ameiurus melas TaxID=219545 RepID=A0A7J5ZX56_AMEME|nr:hypothetical protein AMELA_G00231770 [Ameiurus melas]